MGILILVRIVVEILVLYLSSAGGNVVEVVRSPKLEDVV